MGIRSFGNGIVAISYNVLWLCDVAEENTH